MRKLSLLCNAMAMLVISSANAATLCVNPAGGCPHTTIQAAVTAAAAGDIIKVAAGKFQEQVTIPNTKAGLILAGSGATKSIIDPNLNPDATDNNGLIIEANNVQVIGLGIHNAAEAGIVATGKGLIMKKSQVQNANGSCVAIISGSGELFEGNRFAGCINEAVEYNHDGVGAGPTFKKNRLVNITDPGLNVTGDNATLESNICELVTDACVAVTGNNAIAKKNSTLVSNSYAVSVIGNTALIEGNKAIASFGVALVDGTNPRVLKNTATDSRGDALTVNCGTSPCLAARVEGNRVNVTQNLGDCFDLTFDFNLDFALEGGGVLKNRGLRCSGDGLEIKGAGNVLVEGNTIDRAGSAIGHAFMVVGSGVKTLRGNRASRAGGAGFLVLSAAHVLEENSASNNLQDGFLLFTTADGITLTGNDASGNGEEGFHNQGQGNTFTANTAKGNRLDQDFCNSQVTAATFTDGGGNDFGSTTPPNAATLCIN